MTCIQYFRNTTTTVFLSLILSAAVNCQTPNPPQPKLKYGFNIAPNISNISTDASLSNTTTVFNTLNFRLGFRADYAFNKSVSISPEIDWSFNEGGFRFSDTSQQDYILMPMSFDIMTHVIFKKQLKKIAPYFMVGPNVRLPVLRKSLKYPYTTKSDVALNLGLGLEKKFMYFTFSPELRYSIGMMNVSSHPLVPSAKYGNASLVLNFSM
jgi:hypothetical protein